MLETPVLFLIYNRPESTQRVFDRIRNAEPKRLFIAADGPRTGGSEAEDCQRCREIVVDNIDWDCEVKTLFRDQNLGCGRAVSQAITWFFHQCPQGIILEDDTLPDHSFFQYCEVLLDRYRSDQNIMHISGLNWLDRKPRDQGDYFYSSYPGIWGWASWADRWAKYSYRLTDLAEFVAADAISDITTSLKEKEYHLATFESAGGVDTWDYQWVYTIFKYKGVCITPNTNLISNIGFGENSTHTSNVNHWKANRPVGSIRFPMRHPEQVRIDRKADKITAGRLFIPPATLRGRISKLVKKALQLRTDESQ